MAQFDVVVSNSAIEHRFFHEKALDECVRVLKPGGRFILCLPNIAHLICRWWILTGRFPYVLNSPTDAMHLRFFTVREATALCRARGLEVQSVEGSASLWARDFYPPLWRKRRLRSIDQLVGACLAFHVRARFCGRRHQTLGPSRQVRHHSCTRRYWRPSGVTNGAVGSGGAVMSLKRTVGFGLFWVSFATLASRGLSLLRQLILARLLVPGDFGLVAYASLAIGVLRVVQGDGL